MIVKLILGDKPDGHGLYVAYHEFGGFIKRSLAIYSNGEWIYSGSDQKVRDVVGFIGPLPRMDKE